MNQQKVNGFPVIVHRGREITETQYESLDVEERKKATRKVNGPHVTAKWANGGYTPKRGRKVA